MDVLMKERGQLNTMIMSNKFRATNFVCYNRFQTIDKEIDKLRKQRAEFFRLAKGMDSSNAVGSVLDHMDSEIRKNKSFRKNLMFKQALMKRKRALIDKIGRELEK